MHDVDWLGWHCQQLAIHKQPDLAERQRLRRAATVRRFFAVLEEVGREWPTECFEAVKQHFVRLYPWLSNEVGFWGNFDEKMQILGIVKNSKFKIIFLLHKKEVLNFQNFVHIINKSSYKILIKKIFYKNELI